MNQVVLRIENLSKHYGKIRAVDRLSLNVESGSIYGILGPNGSGKTTTLGIITEVIRQNAGSYSWFEKPPTKEERRKVGAIIEVPIFYPYLSAVRNLKIIADIKRCSYENIDHVLDIVELTQRKHSKFKTYSLGMKQRLAIAAALVGNPSVLILDEPTNGLDPKGIAEIRQLILDIASRGITIILASHLLDEVQKICTHVAILNNGKKLEEGKVEEVLNESLMIELSSENIEQLTTALQGFEKIIDIKRENNKILAKLSDGTKAEEVNGYLFSQGITLTHLAMRKKSLENYFLEVLKNSS